MNKGFFQSIPFSKNNRIPLISSCNRCGLYKSCISPKMPVSGKGRRGILIIGEAPGKNEDEQNRPFVGESGELLSNALSRIGVELRQDCWITNSIICRPKNNATPSEAMIKYCRPNVVNSIKELQPNVIILLGKKAVSSIIQWIWKDTIGSITRWIGWRIPCQRPNVWIAPTYHPSFLLRSQNLDNYEVLERSFENHLKMACKIEKKPWEIVPDYKKEVNILYDYVDVINSINRFIDSSKPISFDFETDRIKPDSEDSSIVCCSMSDGNRTISFPWFPEIRKTCKKFFKSNCPKIGYNIKFENRWVLKHFGIGVNNWIWDGMLAAHTIDSRRGITGLKFQSLVLLGMGDYDSHLHDYMKSDNSNLPNKIKQLDMKHLLEYCGLDSLLEHKVYESQKDKLK